MNPSRRDFLRCLASTGVFAAATKSFAELHVYTTGIPDEQVLKIRQLEIPVGVGKPFKAFHFSDTHLNFFDATDFAAVTEKKQRHFHSRWCRFPQALQSFYASVEYAQSRNLPLLHTGDLVDFVSEGNDRILRRNMAGLDLHYAIGNHEYQNREPEHYAHDKAAMRAHLRPFFRNDLSVASRVIGGVNFVSFDNAMHNVRPETAEGVKREFDKGLPVVLMCHIPPTYTLKFRENARTARRTIAIGMGKDPASLRDIPLPRNPADRHDELTRGFYAWLRERKDLKAILCGHTHYAEIDDFSETAKMYVAGGNYEGHAYEITFT